MESRFARTMIKVGSGFVLLFLYLPLAIVVMYAFNNSVGQKWPIESYTLKYFKLAWQNPLVRESLGTSLTIASRLAQRASTNKRSLSRLR